MLIFPQIKVPDAIEALLILSGLINIKLLLLNVTIELYISLVLILPKPLILLIVTYCLTFSLLSFQPLHLLCFDI